MAAKYRVRISDLAELGDELPALRVRLISNLLLRGERRLDAAGTNVLHPAPLAAGVVRGRAPGREGSVAECCVPQPLLQFLDDLARSLLLSQVALESGGVDVRLGWIVLRARDTPPSRIHQRRESSRPDDSFHHGITLVGLHGRSWGRSTDLWPAMTSTAEAAGVSGRTASHPAARSDRARHSRRRTRGARCRSGASSRAG